MKRNIVVILGVVLTFFILSSCNGKTDSGNYNTEKDGINQSTNQSEEQATKSTSELVEETGISKILFNIHNTKTEYDTTEELIGYIKNAENAKDIKLDDSLIEIGECYIVYSNEDKEEKFGTVYTDISNHLYLSAKSNKKYVVKIEYTSNDTVSGYDKLKSAYEKYETLKNAN